MPCVNIHADRPRLSEEQRLALDRLRTDVMVAMLGKRREPVAVQTIETEPAGWFIGGRCLAENHVPGAYLEAKITLGTNTPAQKAQAVPALNRT